LYRWKLVIKRGTNFYQNGEIVLHQTTNCNLFRLKISFQNMRVPRICEYCKQPFEAQKLTTKCCSDTCAKRLYKQRKKAEVSGKAHKEVKDFIEKPMSVIKEKDFLSVTETCALLGVSRWTVYRAVEEKRLPAIKMGRRTIISRLGINALFIVETTTDEPQKVIVQPEIDWSQTPVEDCYTTADIQRIFNISQDGVYQWAKRHKIPKIMVWKIAYYPKEAVKPFLNDFEQHF
jgi:excisionase family DNA binding protein